MLNINIKYINSYIYIYYTFTYRYSYYRYILYSIFDFSNISQ